MNSPEKISFSAALKLFRERKVSLGKAAALAGYGKITTDEKKDQIAEIFAIQNKKGSI